MTENLPPKFYFDVKWEADEQTGFCFMELTGLNKELEVIEYGEKGSPEFHKVKMPGLQKFGNITLKRGTFKRKDDFNLWLKDVPVKTGARRNLMISLVNESNEPMVIWKLKNAWPVKLHYRDLKNEENEVSVEILEIAHEGFKIQNE